MDKEEVKITPEEAEAEKEAISEVKDEELREKIAEDLGIDPDDESELLEKVFAREKASREKLSGAIKQKISWREKSLNTTEKKPLDDKSKDENLKKLTPEEIDKRVDERLAERDLEALNLTDEIKTEIKDLANLRGISVREAKELPYIKSRIEEVEKQKKLDDATPTRKSKGNYAPSNPAEPLNPANYNLDTKEGRDAWNNDKAARQEHLANNA